MGPRGVVTQTDLFGRIRRVHFVGIGGAGMCGIAEILLSLGYEVSGSDLKRSATTERLSRLGARIHEGHDPSHISQAQVVVVSTAVPARNVEVRAARERQVPVIPRSEMLAELMRMTRGIAVAGSHGKTSSTFFIARVLEHAGLDPTSIVGGRLNVLGSGARLGRGDLLVCEADESDGSFLRLSPTVAVATNMDAEHLETYGGSETELREAFLEFLNKVPFYGAAVVCLDDPPIQDLLPRLTRPVVTYGFSPQADVRAVGIDCEGFTTRVAIEVRGTPAGEILLRFPGRHYAQNALAALAVADYLGVAPSLVGEALEGFEGVARRFEKKGEAAGVLVVDDYAHHPTEIRATLAAARALGRRVLAVFQPHRYSRVRDLEDEFARCFHDADLLFVMPIYPAGEEPIAGVTAERLAGGIGGHGHKNVQFLPERGELVERVREAARPGDLVLTLGAGDVTLLSDEILARLSREKTA